MHEDFRTRIDEFVNSTMKGYHPASPGRKIIHEPIWGSVVFHPWEIQIIDSPLFQRLRGISQVGLAESTYPAARHTRFEHSLGTAAVASRMMEQLYSDARQREDIKDAVGEQEILLVRLAALLHDVGHGPYSHLSEAVYGRMPEFVEMRDFVRDQTGQNISPSPHEIFSYLIIVSNAFVSFFYKNIRYPGISSPEEARALLTKAAFLVVGATNQTGDRTRYSYLTAVINGNFDADKLDYTQRDSYTAGIALTYGVERFLLKLVVCKTVENGITDYRLAIPSEALSTVEELIFNRSMLYHYMYRHQKVLAAEGQMRDALYALVRAGKVSHPCDFLLWTDRELESLYHSEKTPFAPDGAPGKTLTSLFSALSRRTLPKRALELGPDSFEEYALPDQVLSRTLRQVEAAETETGKKNALQNLLSCWQKETLFPPGIAKYIEFLKNCSPEEYIAERTILLSRIAAAYRKAGKKANLDAFDLFLSFQPPLKSDLSMTVVNKERHPIDSRAVLARMERWTESLNLSKWRGYLFVSPHVDRTIAGDVFRAYLKERCAGKENDPTSPRLEG